MIRLAYFVSHPIQYQAPLLRAIAADSDIDLTVFFYSDFSLKPYQDAEFGRTIKWDTPLTEGYSHTFLNCIGSQRRISWFQQPIATDIYHQLKSGRFDFVWIHGWAHICSIQAILAANRLGIPVLMRGECNGLRESEKTIKTKAKRLFLRWLFKRVSAFLYVGNLNYQFYRKYGIDKNRLFPMPYAVDNNHFQIQSQKASKLREKLRADLNLQSDRPIILYAAKLISKKRPLDLLEAYKELSSNGEEPEPYLLFVGDGEQREKLEIESKSTGWQSIRFLGFKNQSDMPAIYDLCDIFVLPSDFEPWGLAINEVMNTSKAVIVSDQVGCATDLVKPSCNGFIFPAYDVNKLAEILKQALPFVESLGKQSLKIINKWSFSEDIEGLKNSFKVGNLPG